MIFLTMGEINNNEGTIRIKAFDQLRSQVKIKLDVNPILTNAIVKEI